MLQLIFSILIISGIGALFALLLELADAFIANYGECRISINREKELVVEGGNPLLFSLMEEGIFIPSACGGKGTCAYCKVKVPEGGGPILPTETPYLTEEEQAKNVRQEGEELIMRGPFGDFYFRDSERDILLIATGTGLAPIMSILRFIRSEQIQRKTTLFFGTRIREDLYCVEELREMEKQLPAFTFIPTLSRAAENSQWEGKRGRVTDLIEDLVPEGADYDVYICGNPDMVDSCMDRLLKKAIPEDQIYFDKFS